MSRLSPHLLNRIRMNRVPRLLMVLSFLLNIGFSTLCMADTPQPSNVVPSAALVQADEPRPALIEISDAVFSGGCLHSETGDCHCNCAHFVPMQGQMPRSLSFVPMDGSWALPSYGHVPVAIDSILRPPIA